MTVPDLDTRLRNALAKAHQASSDFDLNPQFKLPENRKLRPAAVLIGITGDGTDAHVILTKRASDLKHHPGQIAFPGGRQDAGDDGPVAAALREANEEIGLPGDVVDVLGTLPVHETVTAFSVTPVLARITSAFRAKAEPGEVDEVFSVPLSFVTNPTNFQIQSRVWRGSRRSFYTVPYGPYYIWGATARMLKGLAEGLSQ